MADTKMVLRPQGELSEVEQIIADEMAHDERAYVYQPVRYRVASQVARFENIADDTDLLSEITGIVLMSRIGRASWDGRGGADKRPRCASPDGVQGEWRNEDGTTRVMQCAGCPRNRWGSEVKEDGSRGRGKACKEMRRFLVLMEGNDVPVLVTIPPTSCKAFDQYASALRTKRSSYFAVETTIGLEKTKNPDGIAYSTATFRKAGDVPADFLTWIVALRRQFEEALGVAPEYEEYNDSHDVDAGELDDPDNYSTAAVDRVERGSRR